MSERTGMYSVIEIDATLKNKLFRIFFIPEKKQVGR